MAGNENDFELPDVLPSTVAEIETLQREIMNSFAVGKQKLESTAGLIATAKKSINDLEVHLALEIEKLNLLEETHNVMEERISKISNIATLCRKEKLKLQVRDKDKKACEYVERCREFIFDDGCDENLDSLSSDEVVAKAHRIHREKLFDAEIASNIEESPPGSDDPLITFASEGTGFAYPDVESYRTMEIDDEIFYVMTDVVDHCGHFESHVDFGKCNRGGRRYYWMVEKDSYDECLKLPLDGMCGQWFDLDTTSVAGFFKYNEANH